MQRNDVGWVTVCNNRPILTSIKTGNASRGHSAISSERKKGAEVAAATRFTDPVSVDTWDACFRWRVGDVLRDVTIDDTWQRVATAVAPPGRGSDWASRYVDAFRRWRLLPDERLLRHGGTGVACDATESPVAALNVGAFVDRPLGAPPRFDRAGFLDTAALAVRLLDDALLAMPGFARGAGLRVGVLGVGDALARLDVPYDAPAAGEFACALAIDLAEGCLRGAVTLAQERGAFASGEWSEGLASRLHERGMPAALLEGARRHGVRHAQLTSIEHHPLLARLANGASDALAPVAGSVLARSGGNALPVAERALAAAMQPWIDAPIGGVEAALAALVRAATDAGMPRLSA